MSGFIIFQRTLVKFNARLRLLVVRVLKRNTHSFTLLYECIIFHYALMILAFQNFYDTKTNSTTTWWRTEIATSLSTHFLCCSVFLSASCLCCLPLQITQVEVFEKISLYRNLLGNPPGKQSTNGSEQRQRYICRWLRRSLRLKIVDNDCSK